MSLLPVIAAVGLGVLAVTAALAAPPPTASPVRKAPRPAPAAPLTLEEAQTTVRLLDDAYRTILEETHRAYPTRPGRPVAATVVRDLQKYMGERGWPASRFLGVQGLLMNPAHAARDRFEKDAVRALRDGQIRVETVENGRLRVASTLFLRGECSSCHWSDTGGSRAALTWNVPVEVGVHRRDAEGTEKTRGDGERNRR